MRKRGVYGSELIKKRRYWPRAVNDDVINNYFKSKYIGVVGCMSDECYETEFIFLKDPDQNIMMMSTFLGLAVP